MKRPITRIVWVLLTLGLGVIPSLLFFAWVERNMALPAPIYQRFGWPWLALWDASLWFKLIIDAGSFLAFGFFHSLLAQTGPQNLLRRIVPMQCIRAFYLCFTGLSCLALMGCWQSTGILVWVLPGLSLQGLSILSAMIYYALILACARVVSLFDPLEFIGLRQIYSRPEQIERISSATKLLDTGIFSVVRHPIYLFTLAAFFLTPIMSLDRLVFFAANVAYLCVGIPIEERKLEARFGEPYRRYRARVPAVIPNFRNLQ